MNTEEKLLLQSHSEERTKELLETRYSFNGGQKPLLLLGGTTGGVSDKVGKPPKPATKQRKAQARNARAAVREFVTAALDRQKGLKAKGLSEAQRAEVVNEIPKYQDYVAMNRLWNSYITDLLFGTTKPSSPSSSSSSTSSPWEHINPVSLTAKLASADFHGALLTVVSCRNPSTVGIRGIVLWESKNSFVVVVESTNTSPSGLRILEKKGAVFQFTVYSSENDHTGHTFEIIGSRFMYRTAERSGRKYKPHNVDDL